jgi:ATP-binding cassette subfamily F protein 3
MHVLNIHNLTVTYPGRAVFRDLTFALSDQDRVGLVGINGAGKSTLFKAILGIVTPDSGAVMRAKGVSIGYLAQEISLPEGKTLLEVALTLPPKLAEVEARLAALEDQLGLPEVYGDDDALEKVLAQQEKVIAEFVALGGPQHNSRVRELLSRLGFTPEDYDLPAATLSGGQKKLVALARLAVEQPSILLLDEPDNHLDFLAKRSLERFIKAYDGAVLIISHDRYLLDESVTYIAELEDGRLEIYTGNYTAYVEERELRHLRQQQLYQTQQREVARIEAMIKEFELKAKADLNERHARQAKSRRKMLERWQDSGDMIDAVRDRRLMEMQLEGGRGSELALRAVEVSAGFDDDLILLGVNLTVRHGERVGLIGENGAGKSVLFKVLLGEMEPLDGVVKVGPSTRIGYYAQEHQTLDAWLDRTGVNLLQDTRPMYESDAVASLLKFAFTYEQARQPIRTLSGGERSRLQFMRLMLTQPNMLMLDEPTNNLDIASLEVVENALEEFDGAVLVISHDRYFLDRIVDRVVELKDGTLTEYVGGYSDYLVAKERAIAKKRPQQVPVLAAATNSKNGKSGKR